MNTLKQGLLLAIILLCSPISKAQIYDASALPKLLQRAEQDSIHQIERLAALEFHKIINAYRVENDLEALMWDDTMWLASRNHCVWMATNDKLSHGEDEGTAMFNGSSPGNRYKYASRKKGGVSWSGENALYNWSSDGKNIQEIAKNIAESSFTQWKNSKGHDENMKKPGSKIHGVAFIAEANGQVWGTDLFGYMPYYMIEEPKNPNVYVFSSPKKYEVKKKVPTSGKSTRRSRFTMSHKVELEDNLVATLEKESKGVKSKTMSKAASKHAKYLAFTGDLSGEQKRHMPGFYGKTPKIRMIKATYGLYLFTKRSYELSESLAMVKSDIEAIDVSKISSDLKKELEANKEINGETIKTAFGVYVKRVKKEVRVYAVLLETIDPQEEQAYAFLLKY